LKLLNEYEYKIPKIWFYEIKGVQDVATVEEIKIAKEGSKTIQEKIQVALNVLKICKKNDGDKLSSSRILDKLMETLDGEDNFLTED